MGSILIMASVQPKLGQINCWLPASDLVQLDGLVRFWPDASGLEASLCAGIVRPGSGRTHWARYQFSTFRLGSFLPQAAWIILCKTSLEPVWFWLTVRFWPERSGPEANWCARTIWPASGQCPWADLDWIQYVHWVYKTCFHVGIVLWCQLVKVAVQCPSAACSAEWKELMYFRSIVFSSLFQMERVNALWIHCFVSPVSDGKS